MEPDFRPGDRIWFDRGSYRTRPPLVGDVVVLADPDRSGRRLIKSVAAVGPCSVLVVRDGVRVVPPGAASSERATDDILEEVRVGAGELFVTSRRPTGTRDSRTFGPVALSLVEGEVWYRYAPLERRGPVGPTPGSRPS
jgi:type IV secretory pathway protease TraF